jgi:aminoglycoside phosphotransferase family enzyme
MMPLSDNSAPPVPGPAAHGGAELAEKVRFLSTPDAYSPKPAVVTAKETHMSWVFLAGERVFKLKKPVRYPYLDFSTLAAREFFCREELRLNRRLAPGIYKDVVSIRRTSSGTLSLAEDGEIVDWLVEMRRLPANRMLDNLLKEGTVTEAEIERLAVTLARFYQAADHPRLDPATPFRRFTAEMADNRRVLTRRDLVPETATVDSVLEKVDHALADAYDALVERARSGRLVDGHGDLRPEHICLSDRIAIFDCLEFSEALRVIDPFDELATLGMECAACLDAPWLGPHLARRVAFLMGEETPERLMALYGALHAVLRARLSLAHLLDPLPREPAKWAPLARRYLAFADEALPPHPLRPAMNPAPAPRPTTQRTRS